MKTSNKLLLGALILIIILMISANIALKRESSKLKLEQTEIKQDTDTVTTDSISNDSVIRIHVN